MTITLAQAKRLSELGVRKEAYWSWTHWKVSGESGLYHTSSCNRQQLKEGRNYPAYNAEELISMIKGCFSVHVYLDKSAIAVNEPLDMFGYSGDTLTEALGNKLIHDLENGIVSLEEINK